MNGPGPGEGTSAVCPYLLAVRSVVFGTCNLLLLGVPAGWRLGDGAFPPDVDRWAVRDGISWATAARGHWWLAATAGGTGSGPGDSRGGAAQGTEVAGGGRPVQRTGDGRSDGGAEARTVTAASSRVARRGEGGGRRRLPLRVELFLDVRPQAAVDRAGEGPVASPAARLLSRSATDGTMELAGHRGWWARGAVRRGFPGRWHPARALVVDCPETKRRIAVRLEAAPGSGESEVEAAWEAAVRGWRCH